jgi:hypothetical protein
MIYERLESRDADFIQHHLLQAGQSCVFHGRTIGGEELFLEPSSEGVWMSVTPTEDALIVALDFEGTSNQTIGGRFISISFLNRCPYY